LLLVLGASENGEYQVKILRADRSRVDLSCRESLPANTPVRLTLTDGIVLGRVHGVRTGILTVAVEHVSPAISDLGNLARALADPCHAAKAPEMVPVRQIGRDRGQGRSSSR
jgi:hypothetical protein